MSKNKSLKLNGAPPTAATPPPSLCGSALFWVLLAYALVARIVYIHQSKGDLFSLNLIIDAEYYHKWASSIVAAAPASREVFHQDPLYAYFLAAVYKFAGPTPHVVRLLQACIDTVSVALIATIATRRFGQTAGLLAALIAALYGPMVYYTNLVDKTTLSYFLAALYIFALDRLLPLPKWSPFGFFLIGALLGISVLARGHLLLIAVGVIPLIFLSPSIQARNERMKAAVAHSLGVAVIVGAVTIRNFALSADFVPVSSNSGLNFYIGNNSHTAGNYIEPPFLSGIPENEYSDSKRIAERITQKTLSASQVSNFWFSQGLRFITGTPHNWLALMARKLHLALSWFEIPESYSYYYFQSYPAHWMTPLAYSLVLPLGIAGLFQAGFRGAPVLLTFALCYTASLLTFFVTSRYRMPITLALIPAAASYFSQVISLRRLTATPLFAGLIAGAACLWTPEWMVQHVISPGRSTPHTIAGTMQLDSGDIKSALVNLKAARDITPTDGMVHAQLARGYALANMDDAATASYETAIRLNPTLDQAYNNLANLYFKSGRIPEALAMVDRAIRIRPDIASYRDNQRKMLAARTRK